MKALEDRHPLRVAMEARDLQGVAEALAPDVVLHSPITSSFRFVGRDEVMALLGIVGEVLEDLHYVEELGEGDTHVLTFRARVKGQRLEGTDIMRLDEEGRIRELRVFVRPLPGLTALTAALGPRLAEKTGHARSVAVAGMSRTLATITRLTDIPGSKLAMGKVWATPS
jgi:SnoaL-like protein